MLNFSTYREIYNCRSNFQGLASDILKNLWENAQIFHNNSIYYGLQFREIGGKRTLRKLQSGMDLSQDLKKKNFDKRNKYWDHERK